MVSMTSKSDFRFFWIMKAKDTVLHIFPVFTHKKAFPQLYFPYYYLVRALTIDNDILPLWPMTKNNTHLPWFIHLQMNNVIIITTEFIIKQWYTEKSIWRQSSSYQITIRGRVYLCLMQNVKSFPTLTLPLDYKKGLISGTWLWLIIAAYMLCCKIIMLFLLPLLFHHGAWKHPLTLSTFKSSIVIVMWDHCSDSRLHLSYV